MTFRPILPSSGYVGWKFLGRTLETQLEVHARTPEIQLETDYFRDALAKVETADDLVNDRRLLGVALGAFGLSDDIDNRAFIAKVLSEGTISEDAFANRLTDSRYASLALSFGFGDLGSRTRLPGFADEIISKYQTNQFQTQVGEQDENMQLALAFDEGLSDVLDAASTSKARWFAAMGNLPFREVLQTALGLPDSLSSLDLDLQLDQFRDRASSVLGTDELSDLTDPDLQERVIQLFLVRSEAAQSAYSTRGSVALALLQGIS